MAKKENEENREELEEKPVAYKYLEDESDDTVYIGSSDDDFYWTAENLGSSDVRQLNSGDKKAKRKPFLILMLIALLVAGATGAFLYSESNPHTFPVSDFTEYVNNDSLTITIPNDWYVTDSGTFYTKEGGKLLYTGDLLVYQQTSEEFKQEVEEQLENYDIYPFYIRTDCQAYKLTSKYIEGTFDYYYLHRGNLTYRFFFMNADDATCEKIVDSLTF